MALVDLTPVVAKLEPLDRIEGLLVDILAALTQADGVSGVRIPTSSLPADSDPDRVRP